ncbi:hypothetical protein HC026_12070 [Lactobacillus sp. LC28-10]|uniref:Uncharacterized protein n=1 Tax=Secundilactobacillus angelensis TaxID=2722706 RepID=A0ABX1L348_9LACO|nr:hypothetical protein [Secundilactobacillus angelensis]MCH5463230.1 hypothetical protein [Secundilactobacillus angelensis]NLR19623.1 hypothetical protein [Secundilactobacillus angelensis]
MNAKQCVLTGLIGLSFGVGFAATQTKAEAYSTYKSIPHALRGYYISYRDNDSLKISQHMVVGGSPLADSYSYHVTKVNYSHHIYHIHSYMELGSRSYYTLKLNHYAKAKIKSGNAHYQKVSKARYYYFLNHFNPDYTYSYDSGPVYKY